MTLWGISLTFLQREPEIWQSLKDFDNYDYVKENMNPVKLPIRKVVDSRSSIHVKRKLLQEVQVGKGEYVSYRKHSSSIYKTYHEKLGAEWKACSVILFISMQKIKKLF